MADTNIAAGAVMLELETATPGTYADFGELYDPIPEIAISRDSLDDTNSKSAWERSKAGIRKAAPVTFKIKTNAAGYADAMTMISSGDEGRWKYTIPNDSVSVGGTEEVIFKAWVSDVKKVPSLKDETFIMLTLNINEVEGV